MKKSVIEIATERIIKLMEEGTNPWRKPWKSKQGNLPMNYVSKKPYRGINFFLLSMFDNPYFMSFKQVTAKGGNIKKGSKSEIVFFWLWTFFDANGKVTKDEKQAAKKVPNLRYYRVFNAKDIEGIDFKYPEPTKLNDNERYKKCDELVDSTGARIEHKKDSAFYSPLRDYINMPEIGLFDNSDYYYATLFHELGHWTGAKNRLDRDLINGFGSAKYSKEELVAEMTSAFLCAEKGIDNNDLAHNQAAYLKGWISKLKEDPKLLITAASQAKKAFKFILPQEKIVMELS